MRNYTDLTILVDRSGSMEKIKTAMEEALNGYLKGLKESGNEVKVTTIEFDDKYNVLFGPVDLKDAPAVVITPDGSTALTGAFGRAIEDTGKRLSDMPEADRPNQVIMVVITDGWENASHYVEWAKKYSQQGVSAAVRQQREQYNWTFIYLGANQDAFAVAQSYGISAANALNYSGSRGSVKKMSDNLTAGTIRLASMSAMDKSMGVRSDSVFEAVEQDVRDDNDVKDPSATVASPRGRVTI